MERDLRARWQSENRAAIKLSRFAAVTFNIAFGEVDPPYARAARSRAATRFSAPPATINSWAAGLSGGKANDFPSNVSTDFPKSMLISDATVVGARFFSIARRWVISSRHSNTTKPLLNALRL